MIEPRFLHAMPVNERTRALVIHTQLEPRADVFVLLVERVPEDVTAQPRGLKLALRCSRGMDLCLGLSHRELLYRKDKDKEGAVKG